MADPNLALLTQMALAMGPLRAQVVFVGGCATGLLLTQPEVAEVRATEDVDAIVEVFTLAGYHQLAEALAAPYFLATKLEAFKDRGQNDLYLSHDLEDVITVVDGRAEVVDELADAPAELVAFVTETLRDVLAHPDFLNVLPGLLSEAARSGLVLQRLRQMAALS